MNNSHIFKLAEQDSEYHHETLKNLIEEANNLPNCIEHPKFADTYTLSTKKRSLLVRWLVEVLDTFLHDCEDIKACQYRCSTSCPGSCSVRCSEGCTKQHCLSYNTRQMTFTIIDLYLSTAAITDDRLQLLATAAFFIAAKMEESFYITLDFVRNRFDGVYEEEEIAAMEIDILSKLKWRMHYPLPGEIARRLLLSLRPPEEIDLEIFMSYIDQYIEFCYVERDLSIYGFATIAIASIICTYQRAELAVAAQEFTYMVIQYFSLNESHILSCFEAIQQKVKLASGEMDTDEHVAAQNNKEIPSNNQKEQADMLKDLQGEEQNLEFNRLKSDSQISNSTSDSFYDISYGTSKSNVSYLDKMDILDAPQDLCATPTFSQQSANLIEQEDISNALSAEKYWCKTKRLSEPEDNIKNIKEYQPANHSKLQAYAMNQSTFNTYNGNM